MRYAGVGRLPKVFVGHSSRQRYTFYINTPTVVDEIDAQSFLVMTGEDIFVRA